MVQTLLFAYGAFLTFSGFFGAMAHDFRPDVMHSLYAGGSGGVLVVLVGLLCRGEPKRGDPGFVRYMIGVHLALVVVFVFALVFFGLLAKNWDAPNKLLQRRLFFVMAMGSSFTLLGLVKAKPKPVKVTKKTED